MSVMFTIGPVGQWAPPETARRWESGLVDWQHTVNSLARLVTAAGGSEVTLGLAIESRELDPDKAPVDPGGIATLLTHEVGTFPGVRLTFTGRHGTLVFHADSFDTWPANVLAVVESLMLLEELERTGVGRGAQYHGFRVASSESVEAPPTMEGQIRAAAEQLAGLSPIKVTPDELLGSPAQVRRAWAAIEESDIPEEKHREARAAYELLAGPA